VPGFGDDAAVAGGLLAFDPVTGVPAPVGDAIADPVTGVNAALVAVACRMAGGAWLADLALREQIAATLDVPGEPGQPGEVAGPVARTPAGRAPELGADTERVLAEFVVGGRLVDVRVHGERAPGLGADIERVLAELVSSC
jgi:hypothetical protein